MDRSWSDLPDFGPRGVIDNDQFPIGERFDRVLHITRNDTNHAGFGDLRHAIHRQLQLAFDYFVDFFLWMRVLVNGRPALEVIMREGHVRRMKITDMPTGQTLNNFSLLVSTKGMRCTFDQANMRSPTYICYSLGKNLSFADFTPKCRYALQSSKAKPVSRPIPFGS